MISYSKLKETIRIERAETLKSLIEVLIMIGITLKVKVYGRACGSTRKTPKLLFVTPSLRFAILNIYYPSGLEGKKSEDYFTLIYNFDLYGRFER
ncbi:MAG: hypothetical protein QMD06_04785 [Candidatus Altarchaeum sp.]|nr:hypothetical protein [Candidatus Altarchaeum sp.]